LSACNQTYEFFPKKTSSVTSLPLGRQCKKVASFFAKLINLELILKLLKALILFILFTLSFSEITLSEKITSAFLTAFLASLKMKILPLLFFAQSITNFLGS